MASNATPLTSTVPSTPGASVTVLSSHLPGASVPKAASAARPNACLDPQAVLTWRALQPNRDAACPALPTRRMLNTDVTLAWRQAAANTSSVSVVPQHACPAPVHATEAVGADVATECAEAERDENAEFEGAAAGATAECTIAAALSGSARPTGRRHLDQASVLRFWEAQAVADLATCGRWL